MSSTSSHLSSLSAGTVSTPPGLSAALMLGSGARSSVQQEWMGHRRPDHFAARWRQRRDPAIDLITVQSSSPPLSAHLLPSVQPQPQPQTHRRPNGTQQLKAAPPQQRPQQRGARPLLRRLRRMSRRTLQIRQQPSKSPPDVFGLPPMASAMKLQPRCVANRRIRGAGDPLQCVICLQEKPLHRMHAGGFCSRLGVLRGASMSHVSVPRNGASQVVPARARLPTDGTNACSDDDTAAAAAAGGGGGGGGGGCSGKKLLEDGSKQPPGERAKQQHDPQHCAHDPACWAHAVCIHCAKRCISTQLGEHGRMRAGRVPPTVRCPICPGRPALAYDAFKNLMSGAQRERFEDASRSCLRFFCGGCHRQTELFVNGVQTPLVAKDGVLDLDLAQRLRTKLLPAFCSACSDEALGELLDAIAEAESLDSTPSVRWKLLAHIAAKIDSPERRATFMLAFLRRWPKFQTPCCSKIHCFNCHISGFHDNQSCAQYQARQTRDVNILPCPACGLHLVKGDGCSSVRCVCGHQFSWSKRAREVVQQVVHAFKDHVIGLRNRSNALPPTASEITLEATIIMDAGKPGDPQNASDRYALGWTPELQEQARVYLAHQRTERAVESPRHALADLFAGPLLAGSLVMLPPARGRSNQVVVVGQNVQSHAVTSVQHERYHHAQEGQIDLDVPRQAAHGTTTCTFGRQLVAHSRPMSVRLLKTIQARSIVRRAKTSNVTGVQDKVEDGRYDRTREQLHQQRRELEIQAKARAWLSCNTNVLQLARTFHKRMKLAFQTTYPAMRFERMCDDVLASGNTPPLAMMDNYALTALMVNEQDDQPMRSDASRWLALHGHARAHQLVARAFYSWHAEELQRSSDAAVSGVQVSSELLSRASQLEMKVRDSEKRESSMAREACVPCADFERLMLGSAQILRDACQALAELLRTLENDDALWIDACSINAVTCESSLLHEIVSNTVPFVCPEFWQNLKNGKAVECLFLGCQCSIAILDSSVESSAKQRSKLLNEEQSKALRAAFAVCDEDGSGELSSQNLLTAMNEIGHNMTDDEVGVMIDAMDDSGSGTLNFNEFVNMMADGDTHTFRAGISQSVLSNLVEQHLRLKLRDMVATDGRRRRRCNPAPAAVLEFIARLRNFDPHKSVDELTQLVKAAKATSAFWFKSRQRLESIDQPVINGLRAWLAAMHGYVAQLVVSMPLLVLARNAHLALKEARAAHRDVACDLREVNRRMALDTAQQLDEADHNRRSFASDSTDDCSVVRGNHTIDQKASWAVAKKRTLFASQCYARTLQAGEVLLEHTELCTSSKVYEIAALSVSDGILRHLQHSGLHKMHVPDSDSHVDTNDRHLHGID